MLFTRIDSVGSYGAWTVYIPLRDETQDLKLDRSSILAPRSYPGHFKPVRHVKAMGIGLRVHSADRHLFDFPAKWPYVVATSPWSSPWKSGYRLHVNGFYSDTPAVRPQDKEAATGATVTCYHMWQESRAHGMGRHSCTACWVRDKHVVLSAHWRIGSDGSRSRVSWARSQVKLIDVPATRIDLCGTIAKIVFNSKIPYEFSSRMGELTVPALEQMKSLALNGWEFLQDANLVKQVADLGRAMLSLNASSTMKELADIYLSYSFGAPGTARDYLAIADSVATELKRYADAKVDPYRKVRSRQSFSAEWFGRSWTVNNALTAYMDSEEQSVKGLMTSLRHWGLYPDRETVWAIVPFSFVVDWFANVGENLSRLDADNWRQYYNCHSCIQSLKAETSWNWQSESPDSLTLGTAHVSLYNRIVQRELPSPRVNLELSLPTKYYQWITGAALVIQKRG